MVILIDLVEEKRVKRIWIFFSNVFEFWEWRSVLESEKC